MISWRWQRPPASAAFFIFAHVFLISENTNFFTARYFRRKSGE